jgi:hypothetical protein
VKSALHHYARAAHKGAKWLDLSSEHRCVLGQLAGSIDDLADYDTVVAFDRVNFNDGCSIPKALRPLAITEAKARKLGFEVYDGEDLIYSHLENNDYGILDEMWRLEILARKEF